MLTLELKLIGTHDEIMAYLNRGSSTVAITTQHVADDADGPTNANAPAVDSSGLPWDDRIHSKSKAINTDGSWRGKRGVTDAIVAAVTAELRARNGAPQMQQPMQTATGQIPQHPQFNVSPPGNPPIPTHAPQMQQPQYQQPAPQTHQPQYQQPAPQMHQPGAQQGMDFNGFMSHISNRFNIPHPNGAEMMIHAGYLTTVAQRVNQAIGTQLNSITDLASRPDAIGTAVQIIQADGRWQ